MEATILSKIILPLSLFIIMLGMGLALKVEDFTRVINAPKAAIVGILCQLLLLPIIGVAAIYLFGFSGELAVGLLILTFCPGGVTSNMMTYLAKGDTALSISLTAIVSLITPFTIPLFTLFAMSHFMETTQTFSLPVLKTIVQLLVITVLPVAIGMLLHNKFPEYSKKAEKPVKVFSIVFLFVIIAGIVANEWDNMARYFLTTGIATLALNVSTLVLGYFIALTFFLEKRQAISIGIEVGIQNGTLALLVTGTILENAVMTIPAITYSLLMFVTGAVFGWVVSRNEKETVLA